MSKRPPSPTPRVTLLSKRRHVQAPSNSREGPITFDSSLYDELILLIFSHLSYRDLCAVQAINQNWARLSLDNQLWRNLYLQEFGKTRLRGSRGFPLAASRLDGLEVKPLPDRARSQPAPSPELVKDWKWMFRISRNWETGRSSSEEEVTWPDSEDPRLPVNVVSAGGLIMTASSSPSSSPQILLHSSGKVVHSFSSASIPANVNHKVTAMALDQSQPIGSNYRLAVFYSIGTFCLFLVSPSNPKASMEILSYTPTTPRQRANTIIHAVYHHPLLITLSSSFTLSLYQLSSFEPGTIPDVRLAQTLTSFSSHPPMSLILARPSAETYKLVLAYTVPVYPQHWTVSVTELVISSFTVQSSHSSAAFDLSPGWTALPTEDLMETMNEHQSLKLPSASAISTDGRYVAISSAASSSIQLYRLSSRPSGSKLSFVRILDGHTGPVQALYMADGRCISLSQDGSLWVWDLDRGGVEVKTEGLQDLPHTTKVLFDERRIVIVLNGRIVVKRFDV
ncbi:hypothetical protein M422DRAFT_66161 [Sphaerobolus stellatus SS14]|nr:hypothetical protein M422DRAFT_66161 [Sphaerobolus stellatus SS14]